MTTGSQESPMSKAQTLLAHSLPWVLGIAVVSRVSWFMGWITDRVDVTVLTVLLLSFAALQSHDRAAMLCLRCMQDTPLDPQTQIARNRPFLRQMHWAIRTSLIVIAGCVALSIAGEHVGGWATKAASVPLAALFFTSFYGAWTHHRLQPWCPYCRRWDDGGDPEMVPDPTLFGTKD